MILGRGGCVVVGEFLGLGGGHQRRINPRLGGRGAARLQPRPPAQPPPCTRPRGRQALPNEWG